MAHDNDPWKGSRDLWDRAKASIGGGASSTMRARNPHPIFFDSGLGAELVDCDGNRYVDYVLAWGPLFLGHSHPKVLEAVERQLRQVQAVGAGHRLEVETAELLVGMTPGAERLLWSNTGTEAVQVALRLARAATGRDGYVKFTGHYHGWLDNMFVSFRGGTGARSKPVPATLGQAASAYSDCSVAPWNDIDTVRSILARPGADVAAVILEPVAANSGLIPPSPTFLHEVRELCDQTGTLLIFDEVITGVRLASGSAREFFGVIPDLSVMAKGIASGFTLSAVVGAARYIDQVTSGVAHAGTYNGHPVSLAASHATLSYLMEERPHGAVTKLAAQLADGFNGAFRVSQFPAAAHHVGPIVQVTAGTSPPNSIDEFVVSDFDLYEAFQIEMFARGHLGVPGGRWYLSTAHTEANVRATVEQARLAVLTLMDR